MSETAQSARPGAKKEKNKRAGVAPTKPTTPKKSAEKKPKPTPEEVEAADLARREENITIGICPFFKQDRGKGCVSCEGANFHFPDLEARREYVYRFCADPKGYKDCPLQIALEHHYERKYAHYE